MFWSKKNLGIGLHRLGELEDNPARLQQAVDAYEAALEEVTYERETLRWAELQNGLGAALRELGEREDGTAPLEEAVVAYDSAIAAFSLDSEGYGDLGDYAENCRIERDRVIGLLSKRRR
jgi:tetratricopeptide (TPR) repeat protein